MKVINYSVKTHHDLVQRCYEDYEIRSRLILRGGISDDGLNVGANYINLVAIAANGDAIGFIAVENCIGGRAYISKLCVLSGHREQGVGTSLLRSALNRVKESWPANGITAYTVANKPMELLLVKEGFTHNGTYSDFIYFDGEYRDQHLYLKK